MMLFDQNKIDLKYAAEVKAFSLESHSMRRYITLRTLFRCIIGQFDRIKLRLDKIESAIRRIEQDGS